MITAVLCGNSRYGEAHYGYLNGILETFLEIREITEILVCLTDENPAIHPDRYLRREDVRLRVAPINAGSSERDLLLEGTASPFVLRCFVSSTLFPLPRQELGDFIRAFLASNSPCGLLRAPYVNRSMFYEILSRDAVRDLPYHDHRTPFSTPEGHGVFHEEIPEKDSPFLFEKGSLQPGSLPSTICIELSSRCNARCRKCSYRNEMQAAKEGFIEFPLLERLVEEIGQGKQNVRLALYHRGEPLIHPRIREILTLLKKYPNIHTAINTNGLALSKVAEELPGLNSKITVNMDALNREDYRDNFQVDGYEKVVQGIERLVETRGRAGLPLVDVMYCDSPHHHPGQEEEFASRWVDRADQVVISSFSEARPFNGGHVRVFRNKYFAPQRSLCRVPWNYLLILSDGTVQFCSGIPDPEFRYGPIGSETLQEIWHGERYAQWRRHFVERCGDPHFWCAPCEGWLCSNEESRTTYLDGVQVITSPINRFYTRIEKRAD